MRYIIYGAGAVGGVVGSGLFEHGREVVLIARGAHLEALRSKGLRTTYPDRELSQKIPAVAHPSEVDFREGDVVFLTMKTQDTEAALSDLEATAGSDIPVFCLQNGVENERRAARRFRNVYGSVVLMPAGYLEPGSVWTASAPVGGVIDAGRYPEGVDATVEAVAAEVDGTALGMHAHPDIMAWKYMKLLWNLNNSLQAACGLGVDLSEIRKRLEAEALAVYAAAGIATADEAHFRARMSLAPPDPTGKRGGSAWQSVVRGTGNIEADYLNGEIALLGRLHGVPTPYNEAVRRIANRVAWQRSQPGSVTPAEVTALAESLA
jgi:2-dehydropantoate 2-reductase